MTDFREERCLLCGGRKIAVVGAFHAHEDIRKKYGLPGLVPYVLCRKCLKMPAAPRNLEIERAIVRQNGSRMSSEDEQRSVLGSKKHTGPIQ